MITGRKETLFLYGQQQEMKNKATQILVHTVGSLAFLSIPLLSPPPGSGNFSSIIHNGHFWQDMFGFIITLLFFYAAYYLLIPRYFFTGKYLQFVAWCLIGFVLITWLPNLLRVMQPRPYMSGRFRHGPPAEGMGYLFLLGHIAHNFLRFAVVLSIALVLKINSRLKKTQREKMQTEISFLKAQINPHFLFNTLNSIYSLTLSKSDDAPKAVIKLSGIMRYAISEANHDYVPLEKELDYISNYIELQKLRLTPKVKLAYHVAAHTGNLQIAPFLLIPFIENAFKYGVNSEENSSIQVNIEVKDSQVHLYVYNNKVYVQKHNTFATGIGITNTRIRLGMLYTGKYTLDIDDEPDDFKVSLKIDLA